MRCTPFLLVLTVPFVPNARCTAPTSTSAHALHSTLQATAVARAKTDTVATRPLTIGGRIWQ